MSERQLGHRGQSTAEYAILAAVVIAALLAMQIYMKGGIQGKLRESADQVGDQFSPSAYHGKFKTTNTSAVEETLYTGTLPKGASKSDYNVAVDTKTGTSRQRVGQDFGSGVHEQLTDRQDSADGEHGGKLFGP